MPLFHHDDDFIDGCNNTDFERNPTPHWLVPILVLAASRLTREDVERIRAEGILLYGDEL